ncbi:hypothetical protein LINGRAHAP2_LOCUS9049 [Linum grandiflorum]
MFCLSAACLCCVATALTAGAAIIVVGLVLSPLISYLGPEEVDVVSAFVYPNDNKTGWANWTVTLDFAMAEETTVICVDPIDAAVLRRSDSSVIATTTPDPFRSESHIGNGILTINLATTKAGMAMLGRDLVRWWDFGVSVRAWVRTEPTFSPFTKTYLARISCYPVWIGGSESAKREEQDVCKFKIREGRREFEETRPYETHLICGDATRLTIEV